MSFKYSVLGLLLDGPAHGYKIKKCFSPFVSNSQAINDGLLYPTLSLLEKEGLISKEVIEQEKTPNKNLYTITSQGANEFFQWLHSSSGEDDSIKYDFFLKYEFLSKYNFFKHLEKKVALEKLKKQMDLIKEKIKEFERIKEGMFERKADWHRIKILEFGLRFQKLKFGWLKEMKNEIEKQSIKKGKVLV